MTKTEKGITKKISTRKIAAIPSLKCSHATARDDTPQQDICQDSRKASSKAVSNPSHSREAFPFIIIAAELAKPCTRFQPNFFHLFTRHRGTSCVFTENLAKLLKLQRTVVVPIPNGIQVILLPSRLQKLGRENLAKLFL